MRNLRGEELGLVPAFACPGTRVVIRHQIYHVEVVGGMTQVDMLERPLTSWEC